MPTEIRRLSTHGASFGEHELLEHLSPHRAFNLHSNGRPLDRDRWSMMQLEVVQSCAYVFFNIYFLASILIL